MKNNSDCWKNKRIPLIEARERIGLSRPQLADEMGVDRGLIHKVEMGKQGCGLATMIRWVDVLGAGATLELFRGPPSKRRGTRWRANSGAAPKAGKARSSRRDDPTGEIAAE